MKNNDFAELSHEELSHEELVHQEPTREQRIYLALAAVPCGKVVTYGQLADLAGLPRAARLVGRTLRHLPKGTQLPWHRVINAGGKISLAEDCPSGQLQRARLHEEGIVFNNSRISLRQYRWQPQIAATTSRRQDKESQ